MGELVDEETREQGEVLPIGATPGYMYAYPHEPFLGSLRRP